jgi:aminopeptidase YwaD
VLNTNADHPSSKNYNPEGFGIYPNPSHDNIHIYWSTEISSVEITDIMHRVVLHATNSEKLDISRLTNGIYYIRVNENYKNVLLKN